MSARAHQPLPQLTAKPVFARSNRTLKRASVARTSMRPAPDSARQAPGGDKLSPAPWFQPAGVSEHAGPQSARSRVLLALAYRDRSGHGALDLTHGLVQQSIASRDGVFAAMLDHQALSPSAAMLAPRMVLEPLVRTGCEGATRPSGAWGPKEFGTRTLIDVGDTPLQSMIATQPRLKMCKCRHLRSISVLFLFVDDHQSFVIRAYGSRGAGGHEVEAKRNSA